MTIKCLLDPGIFSSFEEICPVMSPTLQYNCKGTLDERQKKHAAPVALHVLG